MLHPITCTSSELEKKHLLRFKKDTGKTVGRLAPIR